MSKECKAPSARRIEVLYAFVQGSYQAAYCVFSGYTAVYLAYKGLTDSQISITSSLVGIVAVVIQLLLASYCDAHLSVPLKRVISCLNVVSIIAVTLLQFIPLPIAFLIILFIITKASCDSIGVFLNSNIVQFVNSGVNVNYGWPRGIGSITYAVAALVMGWLSERYHGEILVYCFMALSLLSLVFILIFPKPNISVNKKEKKVRMPSYLSIVRHNPTLIFFLLAIILIFMGSIPSGLFLIRFVQSAGGTEAELGTCLFIKAGVEFPALFAAGWLRKKFSFRQLTVVAQSSSLLQPAILLASLFIKQMWIIYAAMVMAIIPSGLGLYAFVGYVNEIAADGERVRIQSLVGFAQMLGVVIGGAYAGSLLDCFGLEIMTLVSIGIIAIGVSCSIISYNLHKKVFP